MNRRLWSGALAGIAGGVVFGVMMQVMQAPTPGAGNVPVMQLVAKVVRSDSIAVGWLYHLFNSALLGGLFTVFFGSRIHGYSSGFSYGALWGLVWWVLGGLILMPLLLGMPAVASLRMPPMRPMAFGSLIGHLLYGLILGGVFVRLAHPVPMRGAQPIER